MPCDLVNRGGRRVWQQGRAETGPGDAKVVTVCNCITAAVSDGDHTIAIVCHAGHTRCYGTSGGSPRGGDIIGRVGNKSCAGSSVSADEEFGAVPHDTVDRVGNIGNIDTCPALADGRAAATEGIRCAVCGTGEPEIAVPFDGLCLNGGRITAEHGVAHAGPVESAQTVCNRVSIGRVTNGDKKSAAARSVTAPTYGVAHSKRGVSGAVPDGTIFTVGHRVDNVGTAGNVYCAIVFKSIDRSE